MSESISENSRRYFPEAGGEEELHQFPPSKKEAPSRAEMNNTFAEAQSNIVNEKTFALFVRAITEKITTGSNDTLAFLQNRIVSECVNLSPRDGELIVNQFNREVQRWFVKSHAPSTVDPRVHQSISRGEFTHDNNRNIDVRGIQNVISFLKARTRLLESAPAQQYAHYFNSKLDARYKIDVIEVIEADEGSRISLIQLKSSMPAQEEIELIHKDHQSWARERWLDLEEYENSYIDEGTAEEVRAFWGNVEDINTRLLEFLTDEKGQTSESLITSLRLDVFNNKQKAFILWKYMNILKEVLDEFKKENPESAQELDVAWQQLNSIKESLAQKTKLPTSQILTGKVVSVISVGSNIISERDISFGGQKVINIRG